MPSTTQRHAYKEIQLRQLRGFCETARLGSLAAAAESLSLAQPTVWEQVHALEREFDARLVEAHGRGCRLTEAGQLLAQLAAPLVGGIDALKRQFAEAQAERETTLTLATTERVLVEDLPDVLSAFARAHPRVRWRFLEMRGELIAASVESRQADLGLTAERVATPPNPWLTFEPAYELEPILITPRDHPLARRRRVEPRDLLHYPLVNSPTGGFADPAVPATLAKLGVFQGPASRAIASYTAVIRRYVEEGFGVAVVPGLPGKKPVPRLHERSLARYFGRLTMHLVWRQGATDEAIRAFADTLRKRLKPDVRRAPKRR
jgi:DNA-binding transcriptional LysR family regulator